VTTDVSTFGATDGNDDRLVSVALSRNTTVCQALMPA